jgi:hypothetical protein
MRLIWLAFAISGSLIVSGCETPEARLTIAGLKAYQADDAAALDAALGQLSRVAPMSGSTPVPCSREDFEQRRAIAFNELLSALRASRTDARSDRDRLARLQAIAQQGYGDGAPPNTSLCPASQDRDILAVADGMERVAVLKAIQDIVVGWGARLAQAAPSPDAAHS